MGQFINIPNSAAPRWKGTGASLAALPLVGNTDGDVRVAIDTHTIYVWNEGITTWVTTTGGAGLTNLNGQTGNSQTFAVGTAGTNFAVSSAGDIHTFDLPDASGTARGVITTGTQTVAGFKTFSNNVTISGTLDANDQYKNESNRLISAGEATAKAFTLAATPKNASRTRLIPLDGVEQEFGVDFTVVGASLSWGGLGLDGVLLSGDKVTIIYD